jgi:hypothetical protein
LDENIRIEAWRNPQWWTGYEHQSSWTWLKIIMVKGTRNHAFPTGDLVIKRDSSGRDHFKDVTRDL